MDDASFHGVDGTLHLAMLALKLSTLGHFCIAPGNIVQYENRANLYCG